VGTFATRRRTNDLRSDGGCPAVIEVPLLVCWRLVSLDTIVREAMGGKYVSRGYILWSELMYLKY
jgi:hypothetical protein